MMVVVMRSRPAPVTHDPDKIAAQRFTEELEQRISKVLRSPAVMTAVEALKAQRVVREAGRER